MRYLGMTFVKATKIKCNLQNIRHKFFGAANGILGKIGNSSSIAVILSLVNTYCMPILTYGIDALNLSNAMYSTLDKAYCAVYSKIFSTYDRSVIKQCQYYCGYLPLADVVDTRRITFLSKMNNCDNLYLSVLYNSFAVSELRSLFDKHSISADSRMSYKTVIRQQFSQSI